MKRNAILLQEAYRRDGHADFIKRASKGFAHLCIGSVEKNLQLWDGSYREQEFLFVDIVVTRICGPCQDMKYERNQYLDYILSFS